MDSKKYQAQVFPYLKLEAALYALHIVGEMLR